MAKRAQSFGFAYVYPLVAAGVVTAVSLVAYSMANTTSRAMATVQNQSATSAALSGAANALGRMIVADTDSLPLPAAGTIANGDGYEVPQTSGGSLVDGWTVKIRYCPWDHGMNTRSGRIAGDKYPAANVPLFAVISAGPDKAFSTSCSDVKTGSTIGDDIAVWRSLSDYKKDGVGNQSLLEAVDCESATAPTSDLNNAASNCATSTSRLDLLDTAVLKEGQQRVVRKSGKVMGWQGGAWRQIISGEGNYPAPAAFSFTDLTNQICGATLASAAVQINGISTGTPLTVQGGSYATSLDNVTYSAWSSGVSTISPGTWVKVRASTAPATDYATTSVILNIGGTEKIWNVSNGVCKCNLPWGGTINNGQSVNAYQASSVPFGSSCTSETRVCSGTTLSGTFQNSSCSVQTAASCNLPWGGSISHGQSVGSYSSPSVPYSSSCSYQTRTCNNGSLSGSYSYSSCYVESPPPPGCSLPWGGSVAHGGSVTAYASPSVGYGGSCSSQTRYCNSGSLSGSYSYSSCYVESPPAASCSLPWGGSISHGSSVTAYASSSVNSPATCSSQTRTCNNGSLSGSYSNSSCSVVMNSGTWSGSTRGPISCYTSLPGHSGLMLAGSCSPKGSSNSYTGEGVDTATCGYAAPFYQTTWTQTCQ